MAQKTAVLLRLVSFTCIIVCVTLGVNSHPWLSEAQANHSADQVSASSFAISMVRTGGYAGIPEKFDISSDGRVSNAAGQTQRVPLEVVEGLRQKVENLDVPKSCDIKVSASPCFDCFEYRIVLLGTAGMKRTLVLDDAMAGSDSVSKIAREIRNLVSGLKWN